MLLPKFIQMRQNLLLQGTFLFDQDSEMMYYIVGGGALTHLNYEKMK